MSKAENGSTVSVHYTGTLSDGTVFDSSREREPLQFTLGKGQLIPGFEAAVIGMRAGQSTKVNIPAAEAYGEHNKDMVFTFPKQQVPAHIDPSVGMPLALSSPNGQTLNATITEVTDESITLDGNHPLAGKDLTFDIEVVEIS